MTQSFHGPVPRGIEVLVAKASVDAEFRAVLLDRRADAAKEIGLELEAVEAAVLAVVPFEQLASIIARARVPQQCHSTFLGRDLAAMLAALTAIPKVPWEPGEADEGTTGSSRAESVREKLRKVLMPRGIRPDRFVAGGVRPD